MAHEQAEGRQQEGPVLIRLSGSQGTQLTHWPKQHSATYRLGTQGMGVLGLSV